MTETIGEITRRILRLLPPEDCTPIMIYDIYRWIDQRADRYRYRGRHLRATAKEVIDGLTFETDQDWVEACRRLKAARGIY